MLPRRPLVARILGMRRSQNGVPLPLGAALGGAPTRFPEPRCPDRRPWAPGGPRVPFAARRVVSSRRFAPGGAPGAPRTTRGKTKGSRGGRCSGMVRRSTKGFRGNHRRPGAAGEPGREGAASLAFGLCSVHPVNGHIGNEDRARQARSISPPPAAERPVEGWLLPEILPRCPRFPPQRRAPPDVDATGRMH